VPEMVYCYLSTTYQLCRPANHQKTVRYSDREDDLYKGEELAAWARQSICGKTGNNREQKIEGHPKSENCKES
jgi:hypothetical protein